MSVLFERTSSDLPTGAEAELDRLVEEIGADGGTAAALAGEGAAIAFPEGGGADCIAAILAAEAAARGRRAGQWAAVAVKPADPGALSSHLGRYVIFEGEVLSVGNRSRRTYLNFGRRWSEDVTVVIEARPQSTAGQLLSLWQYRGFYGFLFKEILMRRARGTLLGFWWLILRPLISAVGFIVAFSVIAPLPIGQDIPYPVFFLSGYIPWRLFQGTLVILPRSLGWTRAIMQRTYFPRLLVPFARETIWYEPASVQRRRWIATASLGLRLNSADAGEVSRLSSRVRVASRP